MASRSRSALCVFVLCLGGILAASAQAPESPAAIDANQNRVAAGQLQDNGILNIALELRRGRWHPEADDGPQLFVAAFGEVGKATQIPGPMLRVRENTTVHAVVTNQLDTKATVFGLNTRPGAANAEGMQLGPGETKEVTFNAGSPGTYYYWARTTEPVKTPNGIVRHTIFEDAFLDGAFIVDPAGPVAPDRVFVINAMFAKPDVLQDGFEVVSINGKMYPYTERLDYREGDTIRWRVINPNAVQHPMHLHGAFYRVLSLGDDEAETAYAGADQQSVVTEAMTGGRTMMMEWTPSHPGRWLFHCHFGLHISTDELLPRLTQAMPSAYNPVADAAPAHKHDGGEMGAMKDMAGLVLMIHVKPLATAKVVKAAVRETRKIDLVIEPNAASGKTPTFTCSVREGKKIVASEDRSVGPPIVLTRGEPTEITVVNHLKSATTIHWHGIELDSYYDGVVGGGMGDQITPAVKPGGTFVARFTPDRAGTFIYHTHAADPSQLSGGVYGALVVLEPGESFDAKHDRLMVIGSRDPNFETKQMTINGAEEFKSWKLERGQKYRLRIINMAPNLPAELQLGAKDHLLRWMPIAKDGATLPVRLAKMGDARLQISSGETYDFELKTDTAGEIPVELMNKVNGATLAGKIAVQ